ncbi:MAG: 6-phosphogluconolactonase [bacterium]
MSYKIITFENINLLSDWFADTIIKVLEEDDKPKNLFLSGGSTPKTILNFLANNYKDKINWERIKFFWGDERAVPADHPESNYGMVKLNLFDIIKKTKKNVFPIKGPQFGNGECKRYSSIINNEIINNSVNNNIDLLMLGIGEDGHVASIFPADINLFNSSSLTVHTRFPKTKQHRLTITGKVINNAKRIFIFATGKNKAEIVDTIINKKEGWEKLPGSYVNPINGQLFWLLDKDAAGEINKNIVL